MLKAAKQVTLMESFTVCVCVSSFQTTMIPAEYLPRIIDHSQLTPDLGGVLSYDNIQWCELRMALEGFLWKMQDILTRLEGWKQELVKNNFAGNFPLSFCFIWMDEINADE